MSAFKSKKNLVYEKLKKRIIHHSLRPGEPLDESVLTKELKISKTPIREAFQQLEVEGFIENISGRGRFVSQISVQDIKELFEIREILECEVIKRVAVKHSGWASRRKWLRIPFQARPLHDGRGLSAEQRHYLRRSPASRIGSQEAAIPARLDEDNENREHKGECAEDHVRY